MILFNWLRRHSILFNVVLVILSFVVMVLLAYVIMAIGTRHYSERTVPNFIGVNIDKAEGVAAKHNLEIIINDSLHVSTYPGGVVLDQLPKGGVVVKPGRKIYVTINALHQRIVRVPYVAGLSLRQAKNLLEMSGLAIEHLVYVEDIATDYVLAQFIDGEEVVEGSEMQTEQGNGVVLHVGVSGGAGVTRVPQLLGRSLSEAKSRLWEAGLNVGNVSYEGEIDVMERNRAKVYWQSAFPTSDMGLGSEVSMRLTIDGERTAEAVANYEAEAARRARAKMEADSIAQAEQRLLDSLSQAEKSAQSAPQPKVEEDFFF